MAPPVPRLLHDDARVARARLADELPDSEIEPVLDFIVSRREDEDPVIAAFRDAPEDDEPWTDEDEVAMAEVEADRKAGVPPISHEEIKRERAHETAQRRGKTERWAVQSEA
jgi:hypothetical protein